MQLQEGSWMSGWQVLDNHWTVWLIAWGRANVQGVLLSFGSFLSQELWQLGWLLQLVTLIEQKTLLASFPFTFVTFDPLPCQSWPQCTCKMCIDGCRPGMKSTIPWNGCCPGQSLVNPSPPLSKCLIDQSWGSWWGCRTCSSFQLKNYTHANVANNLLMLMSTWWFDSPIFHTGVAEELVSF